VGTTNFLDYFNAVSRLLTDDGVGLIHAIGRIDEPGTTNSWIEKYIFPGGYVPALSEVLAAVEKSGLWVTDIEILRLHYAETIRHWELRFAAQRQAIAELYDERFCRMWEFYLVVSEMGFRYDGLMIFQLQLAKRVETLPITRDYMLDAERAGAPEPAWVRAAHAG
jgi:cyclopropane-fatty-acyl-phospholipid synthase